MPNVVIIGSGPAGISAALYTARSGIKTTIISKGSGALEKAELIENYYGFSTPISGLSLEENGIEGAKRLGAEIVDTEVVGLSFTDKLLVQTVNGDYPADGVIIATGSPRKTPNIKGIKEYEGKGVSYCAVCDAFFYRGKDVAVLGNGEYALHEATALLPMAKSVTLLTNGSQLTVAVPDEITVNENIIEEVIGDSRVKQVNFKDSDVLSIEGIFIAYGVAGSTALANKIGALVEGNKILVDENMATNIPGLYSAGDCTGGLLQISKAVYEGAKAGTEIIKYLRGKL